MYMQMEDYYNNRPFDAPPEPATVVVDTGSSDVEISDYDRQRLNDLSVDMEEGWASELRRYLGVVHRSVKKDADLVKWWQVSYLIISTTLLAIKSSQDNAQLYPTLARIALDVLPSQASSVACERIFSGSKQIATDRRSRLGQTLFEKLVIMKSAWGPDLCNMAAWNTVQVEDVDSCDLLYFEDMLADDIECAAWEDIYVAGDGVLLL